MADPNFTFLYFKQSGKFYTEAKGHLSKEGFDEWHIGDRNTFWQKVIDENGGTLPGLSTSCTNMTIVLNPHEDTPHGYPLLFVGGFGV